MYICQCHSLTSSQLPLPPPRVLKSILYVCIFIPVLPLGSSEPLFLFNFFWIFLFFRFNIYETLLFIIISKSSHHSLSLQWLLWRPFTRKLWPALCSGDSIAQHLPRIQFKTDSKKRTRLSFNKCCWNNWVFICKKWTSILNSFHTQKLKWNRS